MLYDFAKNETETNGGIIQNIKLKSEKIPSGHVFEIINVLIACDLQQYEADYQGNSESGE